MKRTGMILAAVLLLGMMVVAGGCYGYGNKEKTDVTKSAPAMCAACGQTEGGAGYCKTDAAKCGKCGPAKSASGCCKM